jgi:SanA protein
MNRWIHLCFDTFLLLILFVWFSNQYIASSFQHKMYTDTDKIPKNEVAVVLGASKYLGIDTNYINLYFKYRMETAADLYHAGKVKHILVSGDNHSKEYDEPSDMRDYLMALGVPCEAITLDYAGFRTFDSMIRAKLIFGLTKFTIVSQEFHNQRALFICDQLGIDAIAINAKDVYMGPKSCLREYLAKSKAVLDFILGTEPKFLGCREYIDLE